MFNNTRMGFLAMALSASLAAGAHEYYANQFTLEHPWAEPTTKDQREACVYAKFQDVTGDDKLVGAESMISEKVELRDLRNTRQASNGTTLAIGPTKANALEPGKLCLSYVGLKMPLQWGRAYPMTLIFERAGRLEVEVSIGAH